MLHRSILIGLFVFCYSSFATPTKIFGNRKPFGDYGALFDDYVSQYFSGNFGPGGKLYLNDVATTSDGSSIGAWIVFKRGQDDLFLNLLMEEMRRIVDGFASGERFHAGKRTLGFLSLESEKLTSAEVNVRFRVHRFIGLLDFMKKSDWTIPRHISD
jgi:hypothetical protein